jgi:cytochrome c oxidase cbb3-type subunit I/II
MLDPELTSPGSIMPPYPWLFENDLDVSNTPDKIEAMQTLGVPYEEGYSQEALKDLNSQAEEIASGLTEEGYEVSPDKEIVALIAYLQRLGTDIKAQDQQNEE